MSHTPDPVPPPLDLGDPSPTLSPAALDGLWAEVARDTVDRDPSLLDRLRELPTPARMLTLAGITLVALVIHVRVVGMRQDLAPEDAQRFLLSAGLSLVLALGAAGLSLRALHRPRLPGATVLGLVAVAAPILVALVPDLWPGFHAAPAPPLDVHLRCGVGGFVAALYSAGAVLLLSRDTRPVGWRVAAAAGAGGLVGLVAQNAHCPLVEPWHLLGAHASGGLVAWAVLAALALRRRTVG